MIGDESPVDPLSFETFGAMLRFLRRRARLTQRDLGASVGYSEGHINRFEKNKHLPDPVTVAALFVPELELKDQPELAARLIELAASPSAAQKASPGTLAEPEIPLEAIPPALADEIARLDPLTRLDRRLTAERRVVLCGLPGMGKTTLAGALARRWSQRMPVFWLTLTPGINTSADAILQRLAVFMAGCGQKNIAPLLTAGARATCSLDRQMALIGAALAAQPALLCFDNAEALQEFPVGLQLLQHLSATTPAYLLLVARESLPLFNFAEFTLEGFAAAEGARYLTGAISCPAFQKEHINRLVAKTAGSPMLLRLAAGRLDSESGEIERVIAQLETQPEISAYLLQTVQKQLSLPAWRLLLLLAVFRRPVDLYDPDLNELAASLGGITSMSAAIGELQRRRLIEQPARAVLHPLVRDYVQLTLAVEPALRQRLNRLAGKWLGALSGEAFSAAWHYHRAGLLDRAVELIEEDINGVITRGQAGDAVTVLEDVRDQLERRRSTQADLLRRLLALRGVLLAGTLRSAEGEHSLRQALELAGSPAVRASIICQLAELLNQRSDFVETLRLVSEAQADLPAGDVLLRARLTVLECSADGSLGNFSHALRAAEQALALAGQLKGIAPALASEIRGRTEMQMANFARLERRLGDAMEHARRALAAARSGEQARIANLSLTFIGGLYYDQGDLDASFRFRSEGLTGLLEIGDVHSAAYTLTHLADIHHLLLEDAQALEKLDRAGETLRIVEDLRGLAAAEGLRAHCLLWQGRLQEACRVIERVLKEMECKATERMWGYRLNRRAILHLVQGEAPHSIDLLLHTLALPSVRENRMMNFELHTTLAMARLVSGELAAAEQALAEAPRLDGLSRWAEFDRALLKGYSALACGDSLAAARMAGDVLARAGGYPLYRQSALQLKAAIASNAPPEQYPRFLWVGA